MATGSSKRGTKGPPAGMMTSMAVVVSVVLHACLFLVVGSFVIFEGKIPQSLFEAVGGTMEVSDFQEQLEAPPLMEDEVIMEEIETPLQDPVVDNSMPVEVVDANDIIAASTTQAAFSLPPGFNAIKAGPDLSLKASSGSKPNRMNDMAKKGPGIPRTANIFGRTVTAARLAAVLDISYSTHKTIDVAVEEITEGFPDAILLLTPGCGMLPGYEGSVVEGEGFEEEHEKFEKSPYTHAGQFLRGLLKINEDFKELWDEAKDDNRAYVLETPVNATAKKAWKEMKERLAKEGKDESRGTVYLINANQHAFPFLIEQEVDTIYWMADFADRIDKEIAEDLSKDLDRKGIKIILHDFDGGNQTDRPEKKIFAEETGGDIIVGSGK